MRKLVVNTDHDRTLNLDFATTIAIRANRSLDPRAALQKALPLLGEDVLRGYEMEKKTKVSTLEDIARCGEWGMYEDGRVGKEALIAIKAQLLSGLKKSELDAAVASAAQTLAPNAICYSQGLAVRGHTHIIMSDGWKPIVEGTANYLRKFCAKIAAVAGHEPIFEGGVFTGEIRKINKWDEAFKAYEKLGFRPNGKGIFECAVAVDDSAANGGQMKMHGLAIAFCPTEKDEAKFVEAGFAGAGTNFLIQEERDLAVTLRMISRFANR